MSHNLSAGCLFLGVSMLLLGSLLGLASPSMAQPIPGAAPGGGSPAPSPSVTAPSISAPSAPGPSAPGYALPSSPAAAPAPSMPGATSPPSLSGSTPLPPVPGATPLVPGQPGAAPRTQPGGLTTPTTGQQPPAPGAPEPGEPLQYQTHTCQRVRNSPIERLVAGTPGIQMPPTPIWL